MRGRISDALGAVAGAFFLVSALCGATCQASFCTEDCDPCVQTCICHDRPCGSGSALAFEPAHRLVAWRLSAGLDTGGGEVRTISEILAPSIRRAYGVEEFGESDLRRFAEGAIDVNDVLLAPPRNVGWWTFDSVDVFETAVVVSFHHRVSTPHGVRDVEGSGLSFLFDRAGNLIEIDQILPPGS